jgi:hypothetical protein
MKKVTLFILSIMYTQSALTENLIHCDGERICNKNDLSTCQKMTDWPFTVLLHEEEKSVLFAGEVLPAKVSNTGILTYKQSDAIYEISKYGKSFTIFTPEKYISGQCERTTPLWD